MKTRIELADLEELIAEPIYPPAFGEINDEVIDREYCLDQWLGDGSYREIFFNGIHIGYGNLTLKRTTQLKLNSDFNTVEMHFALGGTTSTTESFSKQKYEFQSGEHNIIFSDGFSGVSSWDGKDVKMFEVNVLPDFFIHHISFKNKVFDSFKKSIEERNNALLCRRNFPINMEMFFLIHEILNCNKEGVFKKMFLDSKVMELMLLQLEQITSFSESIFLNLTQRDIEKMYAVKELLVKNMKINHSLKDLALAVGTNEFTLKKGFKEVFGTSVFQYLGDLRMKYARDLLIKEDLPVNQISSLIGYKNPQHFTAAFKRKYGFTPRDYKSLKVKR